METTAPDPDAPEPDASAAGEPGDPDDPRSAEPVPPDDPEGPFTADRGWLPV